MSEEPFDYDSNTADGGSIKVSLEHVPFAEIEKELCRRFNSFLFVYEIPAKKKGGGYMDNLSSKGGFATCLGLAQYAQTRLQTCLQHQILQQIIPE